MFSVLITTLPVFGLIFCGAAGQRFKILPKDAISGINAFVFYFALPCMLFRVVALANPDDLLDWRFAASYVAGGIALFQLGRFFSRKLWGNTRAQAYARGTATAHGNIGYMGLALVAELLGPKALAPVALAILCDVFVVMGSAIVLYEREQVREQARHISLTSIVLKVLLGLLKSPIVTSLLVGLLWLILGLPLPKVLDNFTRLLGAAAGTCALFAIGASIGEGGAKPDLEDWSLIAIKLLLHPLLIAILMFTVFKVEPQRAVVGVLCAALPAASNTFIVAQRYGVAAHLINRAIVAGTFAAVVTVTGIIWLLGIEPGR
jgi:malonate transporter and related proteins